MGPGFESLQNHERFLIERFLIHLETSFLLLINNLFSHPYTKIEYIERDMQVTRNTASKYLQQIVDAGLLHKEKVGLQNYYINNRLVEVFLNISEQDDQK